MFPELHQLANRKERILSIMWVVLRGEKTVDNKLSDELGEKSKAESVADQILTVGKTVIDKAQEAVEKAQQEGSSLLKSITKEGEKVKTQTQKLAEEKLGMAKEKFEEIKGKAADSWDNLEKIFEDRVARVLTRLGIPSRDDFQAIAKRLDALNENVKELVKVQRVEKAPKSRPQGKDDLKAISGIGPVLESKLNADGIVSYRQIATLNSADIERLETKVVHSTGRIARDNWVSQAKELHFKKYNERL
jgi:poly(hydroxyalkanoate) granule-associated protein